ncbi:tRNA (adenosine(37)-N6)-dimethylallyltransferase MiaA [Candidatus Uhrbacteria bacterium]|nr:tRNA (adenosine(37)-N6)-dimethylallyltransferase MiaA [Candidatus Uhrbacteria bacterium]
MSLPKILVIVGPTASGKTSAGVAIAKTVGGDVLACDSRTVYRGMDIGAAKPAGRPLLLEDPRWRPEFLGEGRGPIVVEDVLHFGLDLASPRDEYNVSDFQQYAWEVIKDMLRRHRVPVLVGGTGLWVDAVVRNLSLPEVPPDPALRATLDIMTLGDLFADYKRLDPEGAEHVDRFNKRRVIRALEVTMKTSRPFWEQRKEGPKLYEPFWIGMDVEEEELRERISLRVDQMLSQGLVNEVRALFDTYGSSASAMTGIGYRELCQFFVGEISLESAVECIKKHTWTLAKRQRTWWRGRGEVHWVKTAEEAVTLASRFVLPQALLSRDS